MSLVARRFCVDQVVVWFRRDADNCGRAVKSRAKEKGGADKERNVRETPAGSGFVQWQPVRRCRARALL
jgi:hypothetical protein